MLSLLETEGENKVDWKMPIKDEKDSGRKFYVEVNMVIEDNKIEGL